MIDQYTDIIELLRELTKNCNSYYIKHPTILSKETLNGNTTYSKYKRYNGKINDTLIKQHINKEIELAISAKELKNILIYKYKGKEAYAFLNIFYELKKIYEITNLIVLEYSVNSLSIYLEIKQGVNIDKTREEIDRLIEYKIPKEWITLPNYNKTNLSNLIILPREIIK